MINIHRDEDGRDSPQRSADERSEDARSGGESRPRAAGPSTEVEARPTRRKFSNAYKLKIVRAADACKRPGEIGELLRGEGLYFSHLLAWRRLRDSGALLQGQSRKRGPLPLPTNPLQAEVDRLRKANQRLETRLEQAHAIIDVQKKVATIFEALRAPDGTNGRPS